MVSRITSPSPRFASPHVRLTVLIAGGRSGGEDDFAVRRCIQELGDGSTSLLVSIGRFFTKGMNAAMHVCVVTLVAIGHRVDHGAGTLRTCGIVQEDKRAPLAALRERIGKSSRIPAGRRLMLAFGGWTNNTVAMPPRPLAVKVTR